MTSFSKQEVRPQVDDGRVFYRMGANGQLLVFMVDLAQIAKNLIVGPVGFRSTHPGRLI